MAESEIKIVGEYVKFRDLDGRLGPITKWILVATPVVVCFFIMDTPFYLRWTVLMKHFYGVMIAMILPMVFIFIPGTRTAPMRSVPGTILFLHF